MHTPECSHLLPSPFFHSTPINLCCTSTDSAVGHWSIDMSRGSLPPEHSSVDIEIFAPPRGVVTPSSVNQFVSSSGPPVTMQLDAALVTSGLSREQAEEIFLLTCEAQTLGRKLTCNFILLFHKEALLHMGSKPLHISKLLVGALTMLPLTT